MGLLLPTLRADLEAIESYRFAPSELPLDIPIIVFGGIADSRVSRDHLEGWALQTDASFKSQFFPGDHFFINTVGELVMDSIVSELASPHAKN
jgi:medium-chain acyl-[acyl-carrier-protein] hydrolase